MSARLAIGCIPQLRMPSPLAARDSHGSWYNHKGEVSSCLGIQACLGSVNVAFRGWSSGGSLHTGEVAVDPHSAGG